MKKILFTTFVFVLAIGLLSAQDENTSNWKKGGMGGLTFSQVSLSNWAAGGENSVSGNLMVNLFANYKKDKLTWDNSFDLGYGLLKQGDLGLRKSDDKIEFDSKLGQYAFENWYYSALINFKTQMLTGYEYSNDANIDDIKISNFMAPAYLTIALGMDYKPTDNFSLLISPATGKVTFVNDDDLSAAGAFGVDPGETSRAEFGGFVKAQFKADIMENVNLLTKIDLFSNYMDNPQNIDLNWELLLTMKINEYLSANLSTQMIYDDDIKIANDDGTASPKLQFKEVFGVGLSYKF